MKTFFYYDYTHSLFVIYEMREEDNKRLKQINTHFFLLNLDFSSGFKLRMNRLFWAVTVLFLHNRFDSEKTKKIALNFQSTFLFRNHNWTIWRVGSA